MIDYKNIIIHPLSPPNGDGPYLLFYNNQYYKTTFLVANLLSELQKKTFDSAIDSFIINNNGIYDREQIKNIINKNIDPILTSKEEDKGGIFLYEKELFSAKTIDRFSNMFKFLFNKIYIGILLIITLALNTYFFLNTQDLYLFNNKVNIYMVVGIVVFIFTSSFFHELGHASACKHFGIQHGAVGFGLYLNLPVLYTDVTEVWKLNRKQRCIVNLAGVYFQCYCLIILLIAFFITGNDIFRYLILIMNFSFLMTLNPFFKFDGYWIVSDLLEVPNLRTRSIELISYLYKRLRQQDVTKRPYLLQMKPLEKYGLLIYSILVNIFMGIYFLYIIPMFLYRFVQTFPDAVNELVLYLSNGMTPPFALLQNIGTQLLLLGLIGYLFWNLINPLIKKNVRH